MQDKRLIAVVSVVSTMLVVSAVYAQKGLRGSHANNPGPQPKAGGPPSSRWDGKYTAQVSTSRGLECPGAIRMRSDNTKPVVTISGGKLKLPFQIPNPAVEHLHSHGCDDRDSKDPDCVAMFAKIKASGASLDDSIDVPGLVVSIDKEGRAYGSVEAKPLPLPDDADDDQKRDAAKLTSFAVIDVSADPTGPNFTVDDHGRNAAGLGKGKVGGILLSTMTGKDDYSCNIDFKATDYKKSGYCAASGYACKVDNDCCNHNCVPSTRSCR